MRISHSLPYFYEGVFEADRDYENPPSELRVWVELTAPSGQTRRVPAFWDGGRVWRFRTDPAEPGMWSCAVRASDNSHDRWSNKEAAFIIRPYAGRNPLYRHGRLKVSADGTHLVHADGTPFFWLADTAWNGVLKPRTADWKHYLATRAEQGFTAIQCVMTDWRSWPADASGNRAFEGEKNVHINPHFFRRLDEHVAAIARHGMVPALVVLWAHKERDPGHCLPEADAITVARYIVARYQAFRPVWMLGGDGHYHRDVERWRRIGRAVFPADEDRALTTLHPVGRRWPKEDFGTESWFDFVGYQSGHQAEVSFDWITHGEPATAWDREPRMPVINLEPCYEAHKKVGSTDDYFTSHETRIALYHSLLASPTAGVSYGHNSIWPWLDTEESAPDHVHAGVAGPWHRGLESSGAMSCTCLKHIFDSLAWWKLRPAPQMVATQPQPRDGLHHIAASRADDSSFALIYLPQGGSVALRKTELTGLDTAEWIDPRTGRRTPTLTASYPNSTGPGEQPTGILEDQAVYEAPSTDDWLLLLLRP